MHAPGVDQRGAIDAVVDRASPALARSPEPARGSQSRTQSKAHDGTERVMSRPSVKESDYHELH